MINNNGTFTLRSSLLCTALTAALGFPGMSSANPTWLTAYPEVSNGHTVTFDNTTVKTGNAFAYPGAIAAGLSNREASGNTLTVTGGQYDTSDFVAAYIAAGYVLGGYEPYPESTWLDLRTADNNTLTITGGTFTGMPQITAAVGKTVTGNTLRLTGTNTADMTFSEIYGVVGSRAQNNQMFLSGDFAASHVFMVNGGTEVLDNTMTVTGGTYTGKLGLNFGFDSSATVRNNRLIIAGTPELSGAQISGAIDFYNHPLTNASGNTFDFRTHGLNAKRLMGFDKLVFTIPEGANNGDRFLTLTDGTVTDLSGAEVSLAAEAAGAYSLNTDDRVHLLTNETGITTDTMTTGNVTVAQSAATVDTFRIETTPNTVDAVLLGRTIAPQTEEVVNVQATTVSVINRMTDFTLGQNLRCPKDKDGNMPLTCIWAALGGENYRVNVGPDTNNVRGGQLVLGARAKLNRDDAKDVTGALYFRVGHSDFSSRNAYALDGDGETYGFGTILRWQAREGTLKGLYAEGNAQLGWSDTTADMELADGMHRVHFHNKAFGGMGAALGYVLPLTERVSLESSAHYQWTRLNGGKQTIGGAVFTYDNVNSERLRIGTRLEYAGARLVTFAGASWEKEFDGRSTAMADGFTVTPTTLRGNTVIGELGLRLVPVQATGWTVEGQITGFTGRRDGFGGSLTVAYKF